MLPASAAVVASVKAFTAAQVLFGEAPGTPVALVCVTIDVAVCVGMFHWTIAMPEVVAALSPHYGADAAVVVAYRVSWPDQLLIRCTLADVAAKMAEAGIERTALILIGPMVDESPPAESHLYDKSYAHLFRKARD